MLIDVVTIWSIPRQQRASGSQSTENQNGCWKNDPPQHPRTPFRPTMDQNDLLIPNACGCANEPNSNAEVRLSRRTRPPASKCSELSNLSRVLPSYAQSL